MICFTLAIAAGSACSRAWAAEAAPQMHAVMLELFTSQGCSSCPPADELLAQLAAQPGIIALAYHVDYWDGLGWTDPFSKSDWSKRQKYYANSLSGQVYTPQMVINGRSECVGSDSACIEQAIRKARQAASKVSIDAAITNKQPSEILVEAKLTPLKPLGKKHLLLMAALVENGLQTQVARGENSGKTLRNDAVVRLLEPVSEVRELSSPQTITGRLTLDAHWASSRLKAVVFLQDEKSEEILATAELKSF